ncbi:MAG: arylsulfatase [Anaerolineae bacterium]|nr:arylsulfatase [Anaerolineae bacterium]MCB9133721.1 arylsulfatase [Anaerolineales bacterium]MCB0228465.1 arylsulfatase [Anaerolineae bacterium]MCB0248187.1 arylsulfatase [Anaerolineae bacterium]MCB9141556.1 arylsulfatase [Anaerolineales bacterium]
MSEKKTYPEEYTEHVFKGKIALDVRDSVPDWGPYSPPKAPEDAPNVLFILYDDTGLSAWSPFGGGINMPTGQKLAENGLLYTQWHTTAICSPTRSTCLTGRNHHLTGFACIAEATIGFPGQHGRLPAQCATVAHILQDAGWSTFWIGKNHNVPEQDNAPGGYKGTWPLQQGFDRFYGFLGGETNQYFPDLVEDNHFIDQPYTPDEGYHLSKDLTDQAIRIIRDNKASNPSKPWYMWFCPGANHAPHQAPQEYIDKYKGKFDDGYEAYREWVLARMIEKGVIPEGTKLTELNPMADVAIPADQVRPWDTLNDQEKKLFARMAEVWAGFSEYTDAQIGRLIDYLEESGQLENTLVIYAADNGTSGEGSPNGSVNENKLFNTYPDDLQENLSMIDKLGGPDCYNHFPTGWAVAFSTPFKMFKRYSEYSGGTCDPLIISWPKGIKARGEIRHQYHHSTDIVPTILDVCGLEMPDTYRGVKQYPLSGVSMRYSFDADPDGPTQKKRQYFEMMGTRGIWEDGWRASAVHAPMTGAGHFDEDEWELYHVDEDRSESTNVADKYPEKLEHLKQVWMDEARKNLVLPLDDRTAVEILTTERPSTEPPRERYIYYPDTTAVPEGVAANVRGRSYKILADVEVGDDCSGVIFAHGSRFGGHSLFIHDQKLYYVYNFLGIPPQQEFVSGKELKPGKYTLGMEFIREKAGQYGESHGTAKLYINDKVVAEGPMKAQLGKFTLCGDGLCVGRDSADAVAKEYTPESQGKFTGGTIQYVEVSVEKEQYRDLEMEMAAAMALD